MGLWTRDEEFGRRLDEEYAEREPFILQSMSLDPKPLVLESGEAIDRAVLVTRPADRDGEAAGPAVECKTTAKAIVKMVDQVEPGDLPALVELRRVPIRDPRPEWHDNRALVIRLVRKLA